MIADVHENETGPIDSGMAKLGGKLLRDTRCTLVEDLLDKREEMRKAAAHHPSRT